MLFNCGEDAQRQLLKQPQIVHGRVNRIFVTSNSSENIYGIPGKSLHALTQQGVRLCVRADDFSLPLSALLGLSAVRLPFSLSTNCVACPNFLLPCTFFFCLIQLPLCVVCCRQSHHLKQAPSETRQTLYCHSGQHKTRVVVTKYMK